MTNPRGRDRSTSADLISRPTSAARMAKAEVGDVRQAATGREPLAYPEGHRQLAPRSRMRLAPALRRVRVQPWSQRRAFVERGGECLAALPRPPPAPPAMQPLA